MNIDPLFETNMIMASIANTAAINAALGPALTRASEAAASGAIWWHGATPSHFVVAERQALAALTEQARALAQRYTERGAAGAPVPQWTTRLTLNVARHGQSSPELPPAYDAYWVADYMVEDGYGGSPDRALGGELVLEDPRLPAPMMEVPDLRLRLSADPRGAFYDPEVAIRPTAGMMLLLPPWVRRRYRPLLSRHARSWVSIALTPVR